MFNSKKHDLLFKNIFFSILVLVSFMGNICVNSAPFSVQNARSSGQSAPSCSVQSAPSSVQNARSNGESAPSAQPGASSDQTNAPKTAGDSFYSSCWSCFKNPNISAQNPIFCAQCLAIQKHNPTLNHFEHFNMKPSLTIKPDALFSKHMKLQHKVLNPKYYIKRKPTEEELKVGDAYGKHLAKAYFTLENSHDRALYMAKLKLNITLDENDVAVEDEQISRDIIILKEEIKIVEDREYVYRIEGDIKTGRESALEQLGVAIEKNDVEKAKDMVRALQGYKLVQALVDKKEDSLLSSQEREEENEYPS